MDDPLPPAAATATAPRRPRLRRLLAVAVAAATICVALWGYLSLTREQARLHERVERLATDLRTVSEQAAQHRTELDKLTAEVATTRINAAALDGLVADLTRGRDELALLEVDRLLTLAAHELQFGDDVAAALAALQAADARLARSETPRLTPLRQAIARDLQRLRAVPALDVNGVALKLDQLARASEQWPLLAQVEAVAKPIGPRPPAVVAKPVEQGWWPRVLVWLESEFGELIRIRKAPAADALLLTETQQQLLRQQFRLRLLTARLALLDRNDPLYRAELAEAQALLGRYFDGKSPSVAAAATQLKQWSSASLRLDLPNLNDSVAALRAVRSIAPR